MNWTNALLGFLGGLLLTLPFPLYECRRRLRAQSKWEQVHKLAHDSGWTVSYTPPSEGNQP